jgi:hypothetical protein
MYDDRTWPVAATVALRAANSLGIKVDLQTLIDTARRLSKQIRLCIQSHNDLPLRQRVLLFLVKPPIDFCGFVDVDSPVDCYNDDFWNVFKVEVAGLLTKAPPNHGTQKLQLAQMLRTWSEDFCDRSIGELLYALTIAVRKNILGYKDRCIGLFSEETGFVGTTPFQALEPKNCKVKLELCTLDFVTTSAELKTMLVSILHVDKRDRVSLPKVQSLLAKRCGKHLCSKVLGYHSIKDLFAEDLELVNTFFIESRKFSPYVVLR